MKLSKKDSARFGSILSNMQRGMSFLESDNLLLCRKKQTATTTEDFVNSKGEVCDSINKECGSEFQVLQTAFRNLKQFYDESLKTSRAKENP